MSLALLIGEMLLIALAASSLIPVTVLALSRLGYFPPIELHRSNLS